MSALPTYEGWANLPTWSVNLWLTNEQYTEQELRHICNSGTVYTAAQNLQEWVEGMMDETLSCASLQSDLLSWTLAYVDWREIVEANRDEEEAEEEEEEEEDTDCIECGEPAAESSSRCADCYAKIFPKE